MVFVQKWISIHHNNGNTIWCDHSTQGHGQYQSKKYAIYNNPSSGVTLLHLAQAIEQYIISTVTLSFQYSIFYDPWNDL